MTAEWKIKWAWADLGTGQILPERYNSREDALASTPRSDVWRLVRIKTMSPPRYHHKETQRTAPPK